MIPLRHLATAASMTFRTYAPLAFHGRPALGLAPAGTCTEQTDVAFLLIQASHGDDMESTKIWAGAGFGGQVVDLREVEEIADHRGVFFT